ncbi:hypothetical protein OOK31_25545 [Streptomyces sp. NBC_00249]|uniref:hypothetical protein n=1 Tax=Streptomyces sp. NBC_00249 TaxID=2975690 RepID=UPI002250E8C4|nr:hypothetical protein [Streptomyces sp. NBC_00249]MCX5197222.1 hypothetical protein [Streptomyces sp. NBC_00249]
MAIYERTVGQHVAERVQLLPGSAEEAVYAALADDPASGWRLIEEPKPKRTTKAKEGP